MSTETDLVNTALGMIGYDPINDINDLNDMRSKVAKRLYPNARDATLRSVHWNCATIWSPALGELATNPASDEWGHAYNLPTNPYCLKVQRILAGTHVDRVHYKHPTQIAYKVAVSQITGEAPARILLCDQSPVKIVYTARILDVTMYDPNLWDAIAERLAADFAGALVKDGKLKTAMLQSWAVKYEIAAGVDESEGDQDDFTTTDLLSVR